MEEVQVKKKHARRFYGILAKRSEEAKKRPERLVSLENLA